MVEETGEVPVVLVTIEHADLAEPIRFSSDATERFSVDPLEYGTMSLGRRFDFAPFQITLPDDKEDGAPAMSLTLSNVGREAIRLLRSTLEPGVVTVEIVLASAPDEVEVEFPDFDLISADYDVGDVTLGLSIDALANEPFPADTFTQSGFGGLY